MFDVVTEVDFTHTFGYMVCGCVRLGYMAFLVHSVAIFIARGTCFSFASG